MQLPGPGRAILRHGALIRLVRFAAASVAAAISLLLVLIAAGGVAVWSTLPPNHQHLRIAGLTAPVAVQIDADGVPRITAANQADAAVALGYLHARDRLFQMDLVRRTVRGRLSEIAGPSTLPLDRLFRTLGLARRASADLPGLPAETRRLLDAYSLGVNAWIAERGRRAAPEFLVLGRPEPWQPLDSLLWGRLMSVSLASNWREELDRAALAPTVPLARLLELWPPGSSIRPPDASAGLADPGLTRLAATLPRFPSPFTLPDQASDEWAVDGTRSETGAPLLAGDPHLRLGFPAIWYLARIDTPDETLAGATAPGIPFLVIGRNRRIAWSFTTAAADTQDLFVETVDQDGRYRTPDGPRDFDSHVETIAVRGQPSERLLVRQTRHGPVISDLAPFADAAHAEPAGTVLALATAAALPGDAAPGLLALDRAEDVDQAGRAAAAIVAPVQNLIVADRARIAMFTTGRVPVRAAGDARPPSMAPTAGTTGPAPPAAKICRASSPPRPASC